MKKFFISLFFFILTSCQNFQISENFAQNSDVTNFHGFQIFFENKESKIFYTFDEMEKILENNSKEIYGFGDVAMVHNDDIASMSDFLVIQILEKILKKPERISENFRIVGLQKSQLYNEKILEKISELPVKHLEFSMFYVNVNNLNEKLVKNFWKTNFESVIFHSFEGCNFLLENGKKVQKISYEDTQIICEDMRDISTKYEQ